METVGKVKSLTNNDWYTITYTPSTRKFGCSCPSHIFRSTEDCKHISQLKAGTYPFAKVRLTDFGTNLLSSKSYTKAPKKKLSHYVVRGGNWLVTSAAMFQAYGGSYVVGPRLSLQGDEVKFTNKKEAEDCVRTLSHKSTLKAFGVAAFKTVPIYV